jgi:MFS family permease
MWLGALVSNTGSWFQNLAVPYVLFLLTHSALWVGLATAAQFLPAVVGGPLGGHLADNRDRRSLLIGLVGGMTVAALALTAAWASGLRSGPLVLLLASAVSLFWGIQMPVWQAFVNDLVPREDLVSAVSLNSLQFNVARALGPALAGAVLAGGGPSVAFGVNAASFVAVILALSLVRTRSTPVRAHVPFVAGLVEAVRYVPTQPGIAVVVGLAVVLGGVGAPVFAFTVVVATLVLSAGPLGLGLLNTALGVGAVLAVPLVVRAKSHGGLGRSIRLGILCQAAGFLAFAVAPTLGVATVALLPLGLGFLLSNSAGQTGLQLIVAARLRGRVMAVRLVVYVVATTAGALAQGWLSDQIGPRATLALGGVVLLAVGAFLLAPPGSRLIGRIDDPEDRSTATADG